MKKGIIFGFSVWVLSLAAGPALAAAPSSSSDTIAIEAGPPPNPWTGLAVRNEGGPVRFAVMADRNGGNRAGVFPDAIRKLNLLQPQFVMSVGDFITGYTRDRKFLNRDWDEVQEELAKLEAPFFFTPGNHDLTNPVEVEVWKKRMGRSYYHFRYRDLLFVVMNTEDGREYRIGDEQAAYLVDAIGKNRDAKWTFLFGHKPMWTAPDPGNFPKIEKALAGMKYTVFAGHTHQYTKYVRNDMKYIMLGVTGGGIDEANAEVGEFDQVVWVTMTDSGPRIANLLLGGIADEDVVLPAERDLSRQIHPPVQAVAVVTERDLLDTIAMKWTAKNESPIPMTVSIDLGGAGTFAVERAPAETVVAAGTTGTLETLLKAPAPVTAGEVPHIPYRWQVKARPEGRKERLLSGEGAIVVVRPSPAVRAPKPVVVDGKLDEWGELPYACLAPGGNPKGWLWKGPADGSFRFAISYDDNFVYAAVRVTDDSMISEKGVNPWDQDGVNVGIEARPVKDWTPMEGMKYVYCFLSPARKAKDTIVWGTEWMPKGLKTACVWSGNGYSAEVAFPVAELQAGPDKPWVALRVAVNLYDFDRETGVGTYFNWTPDWKSPEGWAGSGAFVRQ